MIRLRAAVLPSLSALLIGGAAFPGAGQTKPGDATPKTAASDPQDKAPTTSWKLTLQTDKPSYSGTATIKMTLALQNPTRQPEVLKFATGQRYDFVLQKGKGAKAETLWQWSHGMMFTQMVKFLSVKPGDKLTFTQTYPPADAKTKPLTPGDYTIVGTITTMGQEPKPTATTTFTVK